MEVIKREIKELFIPTARGFKGMAILFFIWAIAAFLICGLVPTIIFTHLDQQQSTNTKLSNNNQSITTYQIHQEDQSSNKYFDLVKENNYIQNQLNQQDALNQIESLSNSKLSQQDDSKNQIKEEVAPLRQLDNFQSDVINNNEQVLVRQTTQRLFDANLDDIRQKAKTLRWITLGLGIGLAALSAINLLLFFKYQKKEQQQEGRSANQGDYNPVQEEEN